MQRMTKSERRQFFEAVQLNPRDPVATPIVARMDELFDVDAEARCKGLTTAAPYPASGNSSSVFVADYLRPAAKKAGVHIEDGQRFGLHNLRHSLSNWLVNKAKVEPKTVQGLLRHSKIQTTLDLYTQEDSDETRAAQGEFLTAVGMNVTVQ
jgi:hypothetical protein